jgi:hypothetical protein
VERATGPSCRATSPTVERTAHSRNDERSWCARLGGRLPPRTAKLAVPPRPIASFRLRACNKMSRCEFPAGPAGECPAGEWCSEGTTENSPAFGCAGRSCRAAALSPIHRCAKFVAQSPDWRLCASRPLSPQRGEGRSEGCGGSWDPGSTESGMRPEFLLADNFSCRHR